MIQLLVVTAVLSLASLHAADSDFKTGIQTWTLRNMNFDQVVEFATRHQIKYLEMIDKHINPKGPVEEMKRKKEILDKNASSATALESPAPRTTRKTIASCSSSPN
jgi:hypothetical protein